MAEEFVALKNISKSYSGVQALDNVSFTIDKGEIHCLVGENGSGKSTLIKIIAGVVHPDTGEILINKKYVRKLNTIDSINEGIQVIYQDLSLFPNLTVAENIAMNQYLEEKKKIVNRGDMKNIAREAMKRIGTELDLSALVGELPIAQQQIVAICRAITRGEKLIIMDEPTSSLGKKDIDYLFSIIRALKQRGISILFVGHKLNEIFEIADRVTTLRDGRNLGTSKIDELDNERLIERMTGRTIVASRYQRKYEKETLLLEVKNLTKEGQFKDINLQLYSGEILGIIGLVGSGRTELALSVFGLNPPDTGKIYVDGKLVNIHSTQDAMNFGIGYLPEDRLTQGLFMEHKIAKNMIATILDHVINTLRILDGKKITSNNDMWIRDLGIKTPSSDLSVKQLSGGNQQKVVLAKWLARNLKILILDGPTIGIDIGAKEGIHEITKDLADKGMGVIMISDEASEVVHNSSRILIMKEGRIVSEYDASEVTESMLITRLGEK